jgi:AAA15 family ATPase/GTPase
MRIQSFRIENFRNLRLAECANVPDFMVLCGGNGCGKSALLDAIMTAKECVGAYGNFRFDRRAVSAGAEKATIELTLAFTEQECKLMKDKYNQVCPESQKIIVEFYRNGETRINPALSPAVHQLLSHYSSESNSMSVPPGFFEYINAYRQTQKIQLQQLDLGSLSDARIKETLALSDNKFQFTKQYLIACQFKDLHEFKTLSNSEQKVYKDSLEEIKELFDSFFAPMKFEDITINGSTFEFIISTPHGNIVLAQYYVEIPNRVSARTKNY